MDVEIFNQRSKPYLFLLPIGLPVVFYALSGFGLKRRREHIKRAKGLPASKWPPDTRTAHRLGDSSVATCTPCATNLRQKHAFLKKVRRHCSCRCRLPPSSNEPGLIDFAQQLNAERKGQALIAQPAWICEKHMYAEASKRKQETSRRSRRKQK